MLVKNLSGPIFPNYNYTNTNQQYYVFFPVRLNQIEQYLNHVILAIDPVDLEEIMDDL